VAEPPALDLTWSHVKGRSLYSNAVLSVVALASLP